jgi:hypothetical protein
VKHTRIRTQPFRTAPHAALPAPPNLYEWVSLPTPLAPSLPSRSARPGRMTETAQPDPSQPVRSNPIRSRYPSPKDRSESAGPPEIRVVRRDPSQHGRTRVYVLLSWPEGNGLLILPYVPAMTATCHRSTVALPHGGQGLQSHRRRGGRRRRRTAAPPGGPLCGVGSTPAVGRA